MGEVTRGLRALLAPLQRRIAMTVGRGVVRLVNDAESRQRLQLEILKGELLDGVERVQNYGLTSHPLTPSDAIIVCGSGSREQSIAIVVDDRRYRLKLQPGEVAVYDDLGNYIQLLRDRVKLNAVTRLEVTSPEVSVNADRATLSASAVTIDADELTVNANTHFNGPVIANGKPIDQTHTHGGVQPGGGTSGPVN